MFSIGQDYAFYYEVWNAGVYKLAVVLYQFGGGPGDNSLGPSADFLGVASGYLLQCGDCRIV
jgi:hypothetical protein